MLTCQTLELRFCQGAESNIWLFCNFHIQNINVIAKKVLDFNSGLTTRLVSQSLNPESNFMKVRFEYKYSPRSHSLCYSPKSHLKAESEYESTKINKLTKQGKVK